MAETYGSTSARMLTSEAAQKFREAGVDTSVLDAEILISHALGRTRTYLVAHPEYEPSLEEIERYREYVDRRSRREPLAYIIGCREFYGIPFEVSPAVLIPRPETEILVDFAIQCLRDVPDPMVADIGVGSGAIAVSIAKHVPKAIVYGTDSSFEALEIANGNAECIGVQDRVYFLLGDLFEQVVGKKFDLIVSNPPYIPTAEIDKLQPEISKYEPRQALDGGPDGLDCYRRLTAEASGYLRDGGILAVEVGAGQSDSVKELFQVHGFRNIRTVRDLSGIERVVTGEAG